MVAKNDEAVAMERDQVDRINLMLKLMEQPFKGLVLSRAKSMETIEI